MEFFAMNRERMTWSFCDESQKKTWSPIDTYMKADEELRDCLNEPRENT